MATIQEALYAELIADSNLQIKLDDGDSGYHVYPLAIPEDQLLQATEGSRMFLVYQKITGSIQADLNLENDTIQISCIADKYSNALALRSDVIRVLQCFQGTLGSAKLVEFVYINGESELKNPESDMFILPLTFRIKYFA